MRRWLSLAESGALGVPFLKADREQIMTAGEGLKQVYLLATGACEVYDETPDGVSVVVKLVNGPTVLGSHEASASEVQSLASIRAAGPSRLYSMTVAQYLALMRQDHGACLESLRDISRAFCAAARFQPSRLHETQALIANFFATYALVFGEPSPAGIRLSLKRSQSDIAGSIGASERTVNRILADWKESGLISKAGGRYVLHDVPAMERLAGSLMGSLLHRWEDPVA